MNELQTPSGNKPSTPESSDDLRLLLIASMLSAISNNASQQRVSSLVELANSKGLNGEQMLSNCQKVVGQGLPNHVTRSTSDMTSATQISADDLPND